MKNLQQTLKSIQKDLGQFDIEKAREISDNEAKTRMYLVEPFFESLRFNRGFENGNLVPEYDASFATLKGKKVDYAILFRNKPEIIIEVKKCGLNLTDRHLAQLNEYFLNAQESKIGVLTNGIVYKFYCRNLSGGYGLHPKPFYEFDWDSPDGNALDFLAEFYATHINIVEIINKAQEVFFLEAFEDALFKEFCNPSRDFIKAIFSHFPGSRLSEGTETQIRALINSQSLSSCLERLELHESKSANSGIVTTQEELKVYHIIKTLIAQNKKIPTESIGFRDYKGKFSIILDENQKKKICDLFISEKGRVLEICGEKFDIPDIDSIIKIKKKLIDQSLDLVG